jgi:AAA family ATP:ADP antiporter
MPNTNRNLASRVIEVLSNIKPQEFRATLTAVAMVFILMVSYFVLRPVRDAMASDWSDTEVSFLWNLQFFVSIAIVAPYGALVSRLQFKTVVPLVYAIFATSFIAFCFVTPLFAEPTIVEKSFYIWVSAFSLFHLSVFWSLMSDTFDKEQGKRLFAIISAGGSAGAIVGPLIPALLAENLGLDTLMLEAASGLCLVVPLVLYLSYLKHHDLGNPSILSATFMPSKPGMGGSWWSGFRDTVSSCYLVCISAFILLYVFIGSFVYFEQKNLLSEFTRPERTRILATIDWVVNSLTFVMAFFVTGRIVNRLGMPVALALIPILLLFGMLALAITPLVVIVMAIQVTRRAGNYAVTRPAREMLFTQVSQEQRFKSKPVIDIAVYRGGDAMSGTLFAFLSEGLGFGLAIIALIGAAISALWAWVAIFLGRQYEHSDSLFTPLNKYKNSTIKPITLRT